MQPGSPIVEVATHRGTASMELLGRNRIVEEMIDKLVVRCRGVLPAGVGGSRSPSAGTKA
jgi:hypothetical protein